jgi:rod shape determining protein RodA
VVVGASGVLDRLRRLDLVILIPVGLLLALGLLLIHSATSEGGDQVPRQLRWLVIGVLLAIPLTLYPYTRMLRFAPILYIAGLASLVGLYFFGSTINHAKRWIIIGGQQVQPSELMKVVTVLLLARSLRFGRVLDRTRKWIVPLTVGVLPAALIVVQPDLGTALLFAPLAFSVVLVSGIPLRSLVLLAVLGAVLVGGGYEFVLRDYQKERIWTAYNYDRLTASQRAGPAYQLNQSLTAISGGGFNGHGHGEGELTQAGMLPLDYNDFIFAVLAEEHGLVGCVAVVLLFCVLVLVVFRVAWQTRDPAGRLICVGIGTLIGAQALVHMAVTLGLAPTTGMTLPLVSYGGSSLLVTIAGLALVQNVAINRPRTPIASTR